MLTLFILCFLVTSVQLQEEEDLYEPLPDYYAILNVTHEASVREIKKSFRKLAMDFHPDKNKTEGAQIIFQELSEAYSILSDPEKKAEYDELFNIFYDLDEHIVVEESTEEVVLEESFNEENFEVPEPDSSDDFIHQEDFSNTEPDSGSAKAADDSQPEDPSELDDETLMKVLKFLADNDYIITKRTRRIPRSNNGDSQSEEQSSTTSSSGSTDDQKTSSHSQAYNTVPPPPHQQHQENSGSRTTRSTHAHHGHTWSASHQHKPRFEGYATGRTSSSSYHSSGHNSSGGSYSSGQHGGYHSSGQHGSSGGGYQRYKSSDEARVYCRTSTRWEGTVKITSKTCF